MIPLTFLYNEYIDRPKFTEQKNPFEYIVPPPIIGVGTKILYKHLDISVLLKVRLCVSASVLKNFVLFWEDAAKLQDDLISPMRDFHFKE